MKSSNITVTDGRLLKALNTATEQAKTVTSATKSASSSNIKIQTGIILKYYYNWDRAEVKLKDKTVLCRLTHPTSMGCDFLFTPFGELRYDENRNHTYFAPATSNFRCLVLTLEDEGSFILSYFYNEVINMPNIAEGGVLYISGYDEHIQLGGVQEGGIILDAPNIIFKNWLEGDQRNVVASKDFTEDNIQSNEYYTKEEVDELIKKLREELKGENTDDTTN